MGEHVAFTPEEEAARDAEEAAWAAGATDRAWASLRRERNDKLTESDWMANSDVTMSDDWKSYRQSLRDLPANTADPANPTWPTEPG
tara:strand:- start:110 stop:370 length:261 start_codon:yes stop_codon:yes gene_type:complete